MILNASSILVHVIQIKNGIIKHANVSVKIITVAKTIMVGILAHVFVRIGSIWKVLLIRQCHVWWDYVRYRYYINTNDKYCTNKCYEYFFNNMS